MVSCLRMVSLCSTFPRRTRFYCIWLNRIRDRSMLSRAVSTFSFFSSTSISRSYRSTLSISVDNCLIPWASL
jgi:hypothetical protein